MKSILKESQKEVKSKYPYLGIYEYYEGNTIVLFTEKNTGTIVNSQQPNNYIGRWSDGWSEDSFTVYSGSVTLSND